MKESYTMADLEVDRCRPVHRPARAREFVNLKTRSSFGETAPLPQGEGVFFREGM